MLPLLHAGGPEPSGWLHSDWKPVPPVIIGIFGLVALYLVWTGSKNRDTDGLPKQPVRTSQRVCFILGALTILIALNPPLDDWSSHFLLSAHMAQHLLLILVAMPLLIAGTPPWLISNLISREPIRTVGFYLTRPLVSLLIANAIVIIWHAPFAYDAALRSQPVHIAEHMLFLVGAFFTWWPVLGRNPEWPSLPPLLACLFLFAQSIPGSIVGVLITFASPGLYTVYPSAPRIWGMSLETDQQIAGLTMWVFTGMVYLGWITVIFLRWAAAEERKDRSPRPPSTAPVHT